MLYKVWASFLLTLVLAAVWAFLAFSVNAMVTQPGLQLLAWLATVTLAVWFLIKGVVLIWRGWRLTDVLNAPWN